MHLGNIRCTAGPGNFAVALYEKLLKIRFLHLVKRSQRGFAVLCSRQRGYRIDRRPFGFQQGEVVDDRVPG